jgi:hypothetical protein
MHTAYSITPTELFYCLSGIHARPRRALCTLSLHSSVHLYSIVFHTFRSPPCTVYSITPTGLCIYLILSFRHTCTSTTCAMYPIAPLICAFIFYCLSYIPLSFVFIFYCLAQIHAGPHHALRTLSLPLDCAFIFYCLSSIHARPRRACVPYHSQ